MNIAGIEPAEIERLWEHLSEEDKQEILRHSDAIEVVRKDWRPLPGPQTQAFYSEADILFYGGSAGCGKTDLILGLAHKEHQRSIIFRREYKQLKGIIERGRELFDLRGLGKFNAVQNFWRLNDNRLIEMGACQHLGDEQKFQGIPHDLKAFDEITHYHEMQFRFLCGWLRNANPNQRKRVVCAGNPPTDAEGDWVIKFWGPWLDPQYPNPAVPGELRWFTTLNGEDIECPSGDKFQHEGEWITPKSRTFIPGTVDDNPYLLEAGYKATLQSLPEPLRSKMLYGDFTAGREDDAWQVIPTEWVLLAQKRWRERQKPDLPMSAIGVDVARGGADKTVITPRYGAWFDTQRVYPGKSTPDGDAVAGLIVKELKNQCFITIDIIGVGSSVYDAMRRQFDKPDSKKFVLGFNAASGSNATDRTKQLTFYNQRAEWYWRFREALDPVTGDNLAIPDDRELRVDLCTPRWKLSARGIQVESKEDIIDRIGRSPDKGDSIIYAFYVPLGNAHFTNLHLMGR
jgi:hypothetical protein